MNIVPLIIIIVLLPLAMIVWNRQRVKGKLLCFMVKKDKSVMPRLCELRRNFVIYGEYAYEVYPDFIRLCRFPMGWPAFLQELVPAALYDEEDSTPLDWVFIGNRQGSSMELRAALDENWVRKLVEETAREGSAFGGINWRKILPIGFLIIGAIGLIAIFVLKGVG